MRKKGTWQYTTRNSVYLVDYDDNRVKRVSGVNEPTPNQGPSGEWKTFEEVTTIYDVALMFIWDRSGNKATVTSEILGEEPFHG